MKFKFEYKGRKFSLEVRECRSFFSKVHGLMFRRRSKPLLFVYENLTREPIHSFFCVPFVAIWFSKGKVIDVKAVNPWKLSVKPDERFDRLLEIPSNNKEYFLFVDGKRNI